MDQVMGNKACLLDKTYIAITLVTLSLRDEKTRQMSFCVCVGGFGLFLLQEFHAGPVGRLKPISSRKPVPSLLHSHPLSKEGTGLPGLESV